MEQLFQLSYSGNKLIGGLCFSSQKNFKIIRNNQGRKDWDADKIDFKVDPHELTLNISAEGCHQNCDIEITVAAHQT